MYLSVCLSVCLSIYLSICLSCISAIVFNHVPWFFDTFSHRPLFWVLLLRCQEYQHPLRSPPTSWRRWGRTVRSVGVSIFPFNGAHQSQKSVGNRGKNARFQRYGEPVGSAKSFPTSTGKSFITVSLTYPAFFLAGAFTLKATG